MVKRIVVDEERCMGCKSCMVECAVTHAEAANLIEALKSGEALDSRIQIEPLEDGKMPMQCQHCADAPCETICPTHAIHRPDEDGPVLLDAERCTGCRLCMLACPFGVIHLSQDAKKAVKCDQCIDRTEAGKDPACVSACPTHALRFMEFDQWLRERRRKAAETLAAAGSGAGIVDMEKSE